VRRCFVKKNQWWMMTDVHWEPGSCPSKVCAEIRASGIDRLVCESSYDADTVLSLTGQHQTLYHTVTQLMYVKPGH